MNILFDNFENLRFYVDIISENTLENSSMRSFENEPKTCLRNIKADTEDFRQLEKNILLDISTMKAKV